MMSRSLLMETTLQKCFRHKLVDVIKDGRRIGMGLLKD
jgi:hypothetical protein